MSRKSSRNVNGHVAEHISFDEMYPIGTPEREKAEAKLARIGGLDWQTVCVYLDDEIKLLEDEEKEKREAKRVARYSGD